MSSNKFFLATASVLLNNLLSSNSWDLLFTDGNYHNKDYVFRWDIGFFKFGKTDFGKNVKSYIILVLTTVFFNFLIAYLHSFFINKSIEKIKKFVKEKIIKKVFSIKKTNENTLNLISQGSKELANLTTFIPNQIYCLALDTFLLLSAFIREGNKKIIIWGLFSYLIIIITSILLHNWLFKEEKKIQDDNQKEIMEENFLIERRNLIIKKNLDEIHIKKYLKLLSSRDYNEKKKNFKSSLALTAPSFLLRKALPFAFLSLIDKRSQILSLKKLIESLGSFKSTMERVKIYPSCVVSQERINLFLSQDDRSDNLNGLIIKEKIEKISLINLDFFYEENQKKVFNNLNIEFKVGKLNHITGANGYGKSTMLNLIMGLLEKSGGNILINNSYNFEDINLIEWRNKISYSESTNLVKETGSLGEKQKLDLENALRQDDKDVFIFDEADNGLDKEYRKHFRDEINKLSKTKLVILVSHIKD